MNTKNIDCGWPQVTETAPVAIQRGPDVVFAQAVQVGGRDLLIFTSPKPVDVPLVRFHSACVFGEGIRATDCDCGAQLNAAVSAILNDGGVITYAWEEGRGVGIADKVRAIAMQQAEGINTAEAFRQLGHRPEPRDFSNHVAALRMVFGGDQVRLASANPRKVTALERVGIAVTERITLEIPLPEERQEYLNRKKSALGHLK